MDADCALFFSKYATGARANIDLAVLLTNSFASALVAALAGIPLRTGYAADGRARLLTHADRFAGMAQHQA